MQVLTLEQFLESEAGSQAKAVLQQLVDNPRYRTIASYDVIVGRPSTFIERHLNYLAAHPYVKPANYLINLKVMIKVREA